MATQKALVLAEKHGNWKVIENKIPTPGPKDILVKIISTALNPLDWKVQAYGLFAEEFPFYTGQDAAGVVEVVGSEVTNFAKGDRVLFQGYLSPNLATFQQYAIVAAEIAAKIPEKISFDQAASVPLTLATVVIPLWNHDPKAQSHSFPAPWEEGGLTKFANKPAFIVGGSSSVGQYAIQMAKLSRFSPIITTASLHNEALLKSLGATHVLDRSLPRVELVAEVRKITGDAPVEYAYDAISHPDTEALAYEVLAPGGALVIVLEDSIPEEEKKKKKNTAGGGAPTKIVRVFGSVQVPENRRFGVELYSRLTEWLEKGVIVPNRVEVLPNGLAGIPEGLDRLQADKVSGKKLIARPQETA